MKGKVFNESNRIHPRDSPQKELLPILTRKFGVILHKSPLSLSSVRPSWWADIAVELGEHRTSPVSVNAQRAGAAVAVKFCFGMVLVIERAVTSAVGVFVGVFKVTQEHIPFLVNGLENITSAVLAHRLFFTPMGYVFCGDCSVNMFGTEP
jgi:hypothetical protein